MTERAPLVLDALLWAWTNLTGRLPDTNTMSEDEVMTYWGDYERRVCDAVIHLTGSHPDVYLARHAVGEQAPRNRGEE